MTTPGRADLRELALAADAAGNRVSRPWQIGHELAKDLTIDGRSMNSAEVAVVQGLEWALDWSEAGYGEFRAWWLDENSPLGDVNEEWPEVWAAITDLGAHPTVIAHLSDMLWMARHGTSHLHARRAVDAYIACSAVLDEPHDRSRALMRAHALSGSVNDHERLCAVEARMIQVAEIAVGNGDLAVALPLFDHLVSARQRTSKTDASLAELLNRAWSAAARTDQLERLAKLLLRRTNDPVARQAISSRVLEAFLSKAEHEEGFGRLVALRDAVRVAEELGHPARDEILHQLETLDTESAFTPIRTDHVLSREMVFGFCSEIVGNDSLDNALRRFATQLTITPESVEQVRESTQLGIRHTVTSVRIGEANSIVTSTETTSPDGDPLAAALERDVLQTIGYQAQMTAFLFLVPALHQILDSYQPWTVADLRTPIETGPADAVVADALARALEHFHNRRYDEAAHVALPRVERLIRHIARSCGVVTTKRPTKRVGGIRGLGEILADLRGDGDQIILPEPVLTAAELTLVDPDSLNLRNNLLHGISDNVRAGDAALILQLGLALALGIQLRLDEPSPATS